MKVLYGEGLNDYINTELNPLYKERFLIHELHSDIMDEKNENIICLYGLLNTGKKTMMLQEIRNIAAYSDTLFIECEDADRMWDLRQILSILEGSKFVFISEITRMSDFIDTCSLLEKHAREGMKIVISGTDSLGFVIAKNDELAGKIKILHTTTMPYEEYDFLFDNDISDYIKYAGTFVDNNFLDGEFALHYIDEAVISNIVWSLEHWNQGVNYAGRLIGEFLENKGLYSYTNEVLIHLAALCLKKYFPEMVVESFVELEDEKAVQVLISYLQELDVVSYGIETGEVSFNQPGLLYALAGMVLESEEKLKDLEEKLCLDYLSKEKNKKFGI